MCVCAHRGKCCHTSVAAGVLIAAKQVKFLSLKREDIGTSTGGSFLSSVQGTRCSQTDIAVIYAGCKRQLTSQDALEDC